MTTSGPSHVAVRQIEAGCLALADISGYTSYLAGASSITPRTCSRT